MMVVHVRCPKCYNHASSEDGGTIYLCLPCNLYFSQEDYDTLRQKYLNLNTKDISIIENENQLRMVYKWEKNYFLLLFSLFWSYLSFSFFESSFDQIVVNGFGEPFIVMYPLLGVLALYWTCSTFINSTSVVVTQNTIRVFCSPMPWPTMNTSYTIKNIEQIYVVKYVSYYQNNVPIYRYKIVLQDRRFSLDLVQGIEKYAVAVTIENFMERYLDIQDKPMDEEHRN